MYTDEQIDMQSVICYAFRGQMISMIHLLSFYDCIQFCYKISLSLVPFLL